MKTADAWAAFYRSGIGLAMPDENLLRILRGRYVALPKGGRALEVGFGSGNNLVLLANSGYETHGLEVTQECIASAEGLGAQHGVAFDLSLLSGPALPYPDRHFSLVVSWAAVYYFGTRALVQQAISEFYRVLDFGGALLLSVIHPNSFMAGRLSADLGDGRHVIERASPNDNRAGMEIFYDATSSGWRRMLGEFEEIEEGYVEYDLFNPGRRNASRMFLARKLPAGQRSGR